MFNQTRNKMIACISVVITEDADFRACVWWNLLCDKALL